MGDLAQPCMAQPTAGLEPSIKEPTLELSADATATCATFQFTNEDHTLGNSLRYMLMKNPDVSFAGYSIPHPCEDTMNVRVQTAGAVTSVDAFKQALHDLIQVGETLQVKFTESQAEYEAQKDTMLS